MNKKICIDPGHVGGESFDLRKIKIENILVQEGDICFVWAQILAERLKAAGWLVELTREFGETSKKDFSFSASQALKKMLKEKSIESLIKKYHIPRVLYPEYSEIELLEIAIKNEQDLLNRANIFDSSNARINISLHLNGDPTKLVTDKNGICGFTNKMESSEQKVHLTILRKLAKFNQLNFVSSSSGKEISPGLFYRDDLILLNNTKVCLLLIEGPFQNNPDFFVDIVKDTQMYLETKVVGKSMSKLVEPIVESIGLYGKV